MFHAPRGRATRRAAPRRAGPPAIRFFILILFSLSLSLSFRLSLTSLPLAFLPLFRRRFSLSSFLSFLYSLVLFSLHSYRPTTLQSACANWASREGETITRGGKKKKKYQFQGFSSRSTRFGDKVPSFPNSFFYFYLSYLSCSVLRILLSIFAWISYSWISQFLRQCARLLIFANPVLFCRIAILLKRALTKVRSIRSTCSLLMVMETTGETTTREVFKLCPSDVRRSG